MKLFIALIAVAVLAAGGYGAYRFGMARGMQMAEPTSAGGASAPGAPQKPGDIDPATGKKVLYWHDPMMPGQKFDRPGKSPFMDMQLVPVYAEGGDESAIAINPRVQQNLGVRTAEVTRGVLASTVEAVGSVAFNERDVAVVQARANGFLERLFVRAPLDPVRKGQPLAELYVPDWVAAQEEYLTAARISANMDASALQGLVDGARQRMRLAGMSEEQIRRVEVSGAVQARMTLVAPAAGVVTELAAREGMTVTTGAPLFRINGLGTVWVNAEVPETIAARVRPGTLVQATASALPGETFKGRVNALLPEVNAATRTIKARVELANPSGRLVPGMFASVNFSPAEAKPVLLVPTEAIIQTGKRTVVIVLESGGAFAPVNVEVGAESGGKTEIRKGLNEGQKVVVSGQFLIDSEASLRGTGNRMAGTNVQVTPGDVTHHATGVVESINGNEMTLSHDAIPSLGWGPMTMSFSLADAALAKSVSSGQKVAFELRKRGDNEYEITSIAPMPKNPPSLPSGEHDHGRKGAKP